MNLNQVRLSGVLAVAIIFGIGSWTSRVLAQSSESREDVEVLQLRPDVYMIAGAGGNIAVQIGPIGVILVDTGSAQEADTVLTAIKRLTNRPVRYIISTSADPDHVGGNEKFSRAGVTILGGSRGNASFTEDVTKADDLNRGLATVLAHEDVLARMSGPAPQPLEQWPTKVYTGAGYSMSLNGEGIQVMHQPAAHSDGDSFVVFRHADVVVTGDIVDVNRFPVIDSRIGGSIQGEIDALNRLLDLVIPPFPLAWQAARTYVIPGHGRPLDYADVEEYRDMVVIVRDVIADMVGRGMTLEQVKAANPTKAYRKRYGADTGSWTTDMFVEAVFNGLTAVKATQ